MAKQTFRVRKKKEYTDYKGRSIPAVHVQEVDQVRDFVAETLVTEAGNLWRQLAEFKAKAVEMIRWFEERSAKLSRVKPSKGGNISVMNFAHNMKAEINVHNFLSFDERLQQAKGLIDEMLKEWTAESRREIQQIIMDAFDVDEKGDVNIRAILSLRKYKFDDPRWKRAMKLIDEALTVAERKSYVRFYVKDEEGRWNSIVLDIAKIRITDLRIES
jgi:hypothetical protein